MKRRIDQVRILAKLARLWYRNPHQRLCQLVSNTSSIARADHDVFYTGDDEFESALDDYCSTYGSESEWRKA